MTDIGSSLPKRSTSDQFRPEHEIPATQPRLDLPVIAPELLAIVRYITAADGPLQTTPESTSRPSPWHKRLLLKALERLEAIDTYLRGRVAFFAAAKDHGYGFFEGDLELAGVALDNCRATTLVIENLLTGRLPSEREFEAMGDTALRIYSTLESI